MGLDLVDVTAKRAELTPDRVAFIDATSGRRVSYAQLEDRAARLASVFAAHGIEREDRVAILCRNRIEFFEALFAVAKLGAMLVPLNWRMPGAELSPLVEDCAPKLLLFGGEDAGVAEVLGQASLRTIALDDGYETLLANAPPHRGERLWRGDAIWTLLYTSGTTGQPKGVIQTVQMSLVNYINVSQAFGLRGGDRTLNFLPLFHAAGIQLLTLPTLIAGGTVTILPGFDAHRVLNLLPELDLMFAVPAAYQQLALEPGFDAADFSHVRAWGCGGAPLPDVLVERYAAKGADVQNGYGMTETGPTAFVAMQEDALRKIGSVGKPQILLDVRIVDAQGRDVPEGDSGEVWMRGPGVTPGYWKRSEETAKAFSAEGWLKSGDLAKRDMDGCYYVVGRIKEMFISGGENVYPAEIENVLARHPAVLEAAVIGVADEKWGEVGHAFVQLRPGASAPSQVELTQFCRASLAGYKTPTGFTVVEDFPRTAAGKVRKHMLAHLMQPSASPSAR